MSSPESIRSAFLALSFLLAVVSPATSQTSTPPGVSLFPTSSVRLLESPFSKAVDANRAYLLALDPDRLLAPFLREARLPAIKPPYGNWESSGLDGHTAGHYLAALADMVAAGSDTQGGELSRRLDHMLSEMERCQKANGDGYIGGVPGSKALWADVAGGDVGAVGKKWVPWYNVHKTFAGLRDAYQVAGRQKARDLLVGLGDWCVKLTSGLSDDQMQQMIGSEYGGMNEVMADIFAITGDRKYLDVAKRFNHRELFEPLIRHEDKLTGKHANTQIPKIIGMERIATLAKDEKLDDGARFFWETVTGHRSVAFGGNSVSEHFNDPKDFHGMLEHREGPETCNTYNMLRLTEQLFSSKPKAGYADYYERALYNHLLSAINPVTPGYVYFTPIRPDHYRVYSKPDECFWCCVGTGMENPGKYGEFIYAKAADGIYVNLFIPSELKITDGFRIRQENKFPYEARTRLVLKLNNPSTFTLRIRHPAWVSEGEFAVKVNGAPVTVSSAPSSYAEIRREWRDGDSLEVELPMHTTTERLPDGSDWVAIMRGPILLGSPAGATNLTGLVANDARMGHVAAGPLIPMDQVPSLLTTEEDVPKDVVADPAAGPMRFRLKDVVEPKSPQGLPLMPFFALHEQRYQIYWQITNAADLGKRREQVAARERANAAREAATLDSLTPGEQQPEVEHDFKSEQTESGVYQGRHWRHGRSFQYTLATRGEKAVDIAVTYSGDDTGRTFDIFANDTLVATQVLKAEKRGEFIEKRYPIPAEVLAKASDNRVTVRFVVKVQYAGGIFDLRLMKPESGK